MENYRAKKPEAEYGQRALIAEFEPQSLGVGVHLIDDHSLIVHISPDGEVRAAHNRCRHMGERLSKPRGCLLTCPRHGWVLNGENFEYENPTGGVKHPELEVELTSTGRARIWERQLPHPWDEMPERPEIDAGELEIEFFAHACMRVRAGDTTLFTDPWLTGPAFVRGWWLAHQPRADWLTELASADAIYISHNHSDHLNEPTLRQLVNVAPQIPIYVPAFEGDSCDRLLRRLGFENVTRVPFDTWTELPGGMKFLIMQDRTDREDSALLVQYKGRRILNAVDCRNLGTDLPRPIDVLLSSFASGASGFPVCWKELYGEEQIARLVTRNMRTNQRAVMQLAAATTPSVFVPFAGYFTEAHPADAEIKAANRKNSPESICADLRIARPETQTWQPQPGDVLDVATLEVTAAPPEMTFTQRKMEPWLAEVRADEGVGQIATVAGLQRYFDWAGYRGELVLHVVETNETFERSLREFYFDSRTGMVTTEGPAGDHPYLRMRVRRDVLHHVLRHGHSWEEISIGFQARFFRSPDVYHFDFWDHFQNRLPDEPIDWAQRSAA